ncbi:MAG: hypothetical protein HQ581_11585 [Planctomycetes bacterium]|nr:hypothetical protein [Planctomycetota bacterium]
MNAESSCPLYEFSIDGQTIFAHAVLLVMVANEVIPSPGAGSDWQRFEAFVIKRARTVFGQWPAYLVRPSTSVSSDRFTGIRVFASCSSFRPDSPEMIQKALLVWHQESAEISFSNSVQLCEVPWSELAEEVDY